GLLQYVLSSRALGRAGQDPAGASTAEGARQSRRQALIWGAGALVVIAAWALYQRSTTGGIQPTAIRDAAGYSLVLITVVFFARLFLDRGWTREERGRLAVIFVFFACAAIFWAVFEQ